MPESAASSPTRSLEARDPVSTVGGAVLRSARSDDLAAIERLLVASQLPTTGVADALEGFIVAEHDGKVVGVIGLERCSEYALLRSAAVDASWRGRGLGRELVHRIIAEAETRGVRALYLLTATAEHYFPSFGFQPTSRDEVPDPVRRTREFRDLCPASAAVMRRGIAPER